MRSRQSLVACLLALLLVFAQQAAFTHLIGHLSGQSSAQAIADHEDRAHGSALSLTHNCATCVALATLGGPPTAPFAIVLTAVAAVTSFCLPSFAAPSRHGTAYSARAPPQIL
jgi:hypothetical protein